MHKIFIIIALSLVACCKPSNIPKSIPAPVSTSTTRGISLPAGFSVVEQSSAGYFIRLSSAERATINTIRELADSLTDKFDRIDLCLDVPPWARR